LHPHLEELALLDVDPVIELPEAAGEDQQGEEPEISHEKTAPFAFQERYPSPGPSAKETHDPRLQAFSSIRLAKTRVDARIICPFTQAAVALQIDQGKLGAAGLKSTVLADSGPRSFPVALAAKDAAPPAVMKIQGLSDQKAHGAGFMKPQALAVLI